MEEHINFNSEVKYSEMPVVNLLEPNARIPVIISTDTPSKTGFINGTISFDNISKLIVRITQDYLSNQNEELENKINLLSNNIINIYALTNTNSTTPIINKLQASIPDNWQTTPNFKQYGYLWMSIGHIDDHGFYIKNKNNEYWINPICLGAIDAIGEDSNKYNYIYCYTDKEKTFSTRGITQSLINNIENSILKSSYDDINKIEWHDHRLSISPEFPYEYSAIFNNLLKKCEDIILSSKYGFNGRDADNIEYIYKLSNLLYTTFEELLTLYPINIFNHPNYLKKDFIPEGWSDDQLSPTPALPYLYVTYRESTFDDLDKVSKWGPFKSIKFWNSYNIPNDNYKVEIINDNWGLSEKLNNKILKLLTYTTILVYNKSGNLEPITGLNIVSVPEGFRVIIEDTNHLYLETVNGEINYTEETYKLCTFNIQILDGITLPAVIGIYKTPGNYILNVSPTIINLNNSVPVHVEIHEINVLGEKIPLLEKEWKTFKIIQKDLLTNEELEILPPGIISNLNEGSTIITLYKIINNEKVFIDEETLTVIKPTGKDGDSTFTSYVFKRALPLENGTIPAPIGGSYYNSTPEGWNDETPEGSNPLWMSYRRFSTNPELQEDSWHEPILIGDTSNIDYCFSDSIDNPGEPDPERHFQEDLGNSWHNTPTPDSIWMAIDKLHNGEWEGWKIIKIKGETGAPGNSGDTYLNIQLYKKSTIEAPPIINRKKSDLDGWKNSFEAISENEHIWMIVATKKNDDFERDDNENIWSVPLRITGLNGEIGKDGTDINFIYYRTDERKLPFTLQITPNEAETLFNTNDCIKLQENGEVIGGNEEDEGWRDHPLGINNIKKYEYISIATKSSGIWTNYSSPVLWSNWGEKGNDGDGVEYIFCLSDIKIDDPATLLPEINNSNFLNDGYIPDNWNDDPQDVSEDNPYQYVSIRKQKNGVWLNFSTPTLWGYYGKDGKDGIVNGFILTSNNDTVILDDDTISPDSFNAAASATFELQDSSRTTNEEDIKYIISEIDSKFSDLFTPNITKLGNLTYTINTSELNNNKLTLGIYSVAIDAYVKSDVGTVIFDNETYIKVAQRKLIIQIKNFNNGDAYRLVVTPNSIKINEDGYAYEGVDLDVSALIISGDNDPEVIRPEIIIPDNTKNILSGNLYYTIEQNGESNKLIDPYKLNTISFDSAYKYLVVNLYLKTSNGSIKVDSETINIVLDGSKGINGLSVYEANVFTRSKERPDNEYWLTDQGIYSNPREGIENTIWTDTIPAGTETVWMQTRTYTSDGQPPLSNWRTPVSLVSTDKFDVVYSSYLTKPTEVPSHRDSGILNNEWHNEAIGDEVWMATSYKYAENELWSDWVITRIKGEKGDMGYISTLDLSNDADIILIDMDGNPLPNLTIETKLSLTNNIGKLIEDKYDVYINNSDSSIGYDPSKDIITYSIPNDWNLKEGSKKYIYFKADYNNGLVIAETALSLTAKNSSYKLQLNNLGPLLVGDSYKPIVYLISGDNNTTVDSTKYKLKIQVNLDTYILGTDEIDTNIISVSEDGTITAKNVGSFRIQLYDINNTWWDSNTISIYALKNSQSSSFNVLNEAVWINKESKQLFFNFEYSSEYVYFDSGYIRAYWGGTDTLIEFGESIEANNPWDKESRNNIKLTNMPDKGISQSVWLPYSSIEVKITSSNGTNIIFSKQIPIQIPSGVYQELNDNYFKLKYLGSDLPEGTFISTIYLDSTRILAELDTQKLTIINHTNAIERNKALIDVTADNLKSIYSNIILNVDNILYPFITLEGKTIGWSNENCTWDKYGNLNAIYVVLEITFTPDTPITLYSLDSENDTPLTISNPGTSYYELVKTIITPEFTVREDGNYYFSTNNNHLNIELYSKTSSVEDFIIETLESNSLPLSISLTSNKIYKVKYIEKLDGVGAIAYRSILTLSLPIIEKGTERTWFLGSSLSELSLRANKISANVQNMQNNISTLLATSKQIEAQTKNLITNLLSSFGISSDNITLIHTEPDETKTGLTINAQGSTFKGKVNATELNVVDSENTPKMQLTTYDPDIHKLNDEEANRMGITTGDPIIILINQSGTKFILNMTALNLSEVKYTDEKLIQLTGYPYIELLKNINPINYTYYSECSSKNKNNVDYYPGSEGWSTNEPDSLHTICKYNTKDKDSTESGICIMLKISESYLFKYISNDIMLNVACIEFKIDSTYDLEGNRKDINNFVIWHGTGDVIGAYQLNYNTINGTDVTQIIENYDSLEVNCDYRKFFINYNKWLEIIDIQKFKSNINNSTLKLYSVIVYNDSSKKCLILYIKDTNDNCIPLQLIISNNGAFNSTNDCTIYNAFLLGDSGINNLTTTNIGQLKTINKESTLLLSNNNINNIKSEHYVTSVLKNNNHEKTSWELDSNWYDCVYTHTFDEKYIFDSDLIHDIINGAYSSPLTVDYRPVESQWIYF